MFRTLPSFRLRSYLMLASGAAAFIALMFVTAPYGRYAEKASPLYGFKINGKLAWIVQEAPSFFLPVFMWWTASKDPSRAALLSNVNANTILLIMFLFHYFNRSFVFPLRIVGGKPTPAVVCLMALAFCLWNGYIQGRFLTHFVTYPDTEIWEPHFVLGVVIFFTGLFINWQADDILRHLRKPGETAYKIPRVRIVVLKAVPY